MKLSENNSLKGKVALITGASGDLGERILETVASMGSNVVAHYYSDSKKSKVADICKALQSTGCDCCVHQSDLTKESEVVELFESAVDAFGKVDIVINTAGTMLKKNLAETTLEEYDNIFDIHAKGAFMMLKYAAQCLENNGRIINISTSLTGMSRAPQYSVYAAAKAASEQFTKYLAAEVGHRGITVNTISPGPMDNDFLRSEEDEQSLEFLKSISLFSRLGTSDDVTPLVKLLVSEGGRWITGQNIRVNGGML